jgi:hypothetical protein
MYVEGPFLRGVGFLIAMVMVGSGIVLWQEWGPLVLLKGLITFPIVFVLRWRIKSMLGRVFKMIGVLLGKLGRGRGTRVLEREK